MLKQASRPEGTWLHACTQNAKAQLKQPQRRKLPWMKDDENTPAASGDLLTAVASAPVAEAATKAAAAATEAEAAAASATEAAASATEAAAVAMAASETEPVEAAEVVQACSRYLCRACASTPPVATDRDATATLRRCKWSSRRVKPS